MLRIHGKSKIALALACALATAVVCGCSSTNQAVSTGPAAAPAGAKVDPPIGYANGVYTGFDRNDYPGDDIMQKMRTEHAAFSFTGYWLTPPPEEKTNSWRGKRAALAAQGFGFLLLSNGRLYRALKASGNPQLLGKRDAAAAVAAARREGFAEGATIFLD